MDIINANSEVRPQSNEIVNKNGSKISLRRSLNWAWKTFQNNPMFYMGIVLTFFASWVVLEAMVVAGQRLGAIFNLAIHTIFLIVFSGLQMGFMKICLEVYKGNKPPYAELFRSIKQGAKFLIAQFLYLLMFFAGLFLLIVPGLYFGTRFCFFGFDLAEKENKFMDSFRASVLLTENSILKLAYHLLVLTLLNLVGAAVLGLGLLITVPVTVLTMIWLYQSLKSEPPLETS
jgi:uncharacterized membrane protein